MASATITRAEPKLKAHSAHGQRPRGLDSSCGTPRSGPSLASLRLMRPVKAPFRVVSQETLAQAFFGDRGNQARRGEESNGIR